MPSKFHVQPCLISVVSRGRQLLSQSSSGLIYFGMTVCSLCGFRLSDFRNNLFNFNYANTKRFDMISPPILGCTGPSLTKLALRSQLATRSSSDFRDMESYCGAASRACKQCTNLESRARCKTQTKMNTSIFANTLACFLTAFKRFSQYCLNAFRLMAFGIQSGKKIARHPLSVYNASVNFIFKKREPKEETQSKREH